VSNTFVKKMNWVVHLFKKLIKIFAITNLLHIFKNILKQACMKSIYQ